MVIPTYDRESFFGHINPLLLGWWPSLIIWKQWGFKRKHIWQWIQPQPDHPTWNHATNHHLREDLDLQIFDAWNKNQNIFSQMVLKHGDEYHCSKETISWNKFKNIVGSLVFLFATPKKPLSFSAGKLQLLRILAVLHKKKNSTVAQFAREKVRKCDPTRPKRTALGGAFHGCQPI